MAACCHRWPAGCIDIGRGQGSDFGTDGGPADDYIFGALRLYIESGYPGFADGCQGCQTGESAGDFCDFQPGGY